MAVVALLSPASWPRTLLLVVAAAYLLIAALSLFAWPAWAARRSPYLREPYRLELGREAIRWSTPSVESRLPWSYFKGWAIDRDAIYLSLGYGQATVLPRRALAERQEEIAALLRDVLGAERWSA